LTDQRNSPHKGNKDLPLSARNTAISDTDIFDTGAWRMSAAEVRVNNERAVLTAIATSAGASAADLARRTGLVPQSISRILLDLEKADLVSRGEARRGFRGQPATPIHINPEGAFAIGCELGWRHYHILLRDLSGNVLGEHRRRYEYPRAATIFEEIASVANLLVNLIPAPKRDRVLGMGLAAPNSIARNITLIGAPEEESLAWQDVDLAAVATKAAGMPVTLFNDGNAACWGEMVAMQPPRPTDMAYLTVGTFVGAGLIADGHLWEGRSGNAANLGGMLVSDGVRPPQRSHLIASLHALERMLIDAGMEYPSGLPEQWDWQKLEPVATTWLRNAATWLSLTIINAAAVSEFPVVVVDATLPPHILDRLVRKIEANLAEWPALTTDHPKVIKGRLGGRAAAMGAALMPIYRRYFSRKAADTGL
jgi:predicted NBD/HSP70 family sugar kinase